jgi:hypothetical protein
MDCNNVGSMISELYDGEPMSPEAVDHIVKCGSCRERLRDYAAISAEVRLLAAQEREEMKMPTMMREAMPKKNSFLFAWRKTMRVPRFAAAACALVIIVLAGGWAHTRAQNTPLWFQFRLSFNIRGGEPASVGAVVKVCPQGCEHVFTVSQTERIAGIIDAQRIEDGKVYLTLRVKRFARLPDIKDLAREMSDVSATEYVYQPGKVIDVPVNDVGTFKMDGLIVASAEGVLNWINPPSLLDQNKFVVVEGVLIRDERVIAEMPGSGSASGGSADADAGFYTYVPEYGLFAIGLKPFKGATAGTAYYGQIRFAENGVKYMMLAGSQITGGTQPRTVWILHVPAYVPSLHDPQAKDDQLQFGTSPAIDKTLQGMGAIKQQ